MKLTEFWVNLRGRDPSDLILEELELQRTISTSKGAKILYLRDINTGKESILLSRIKGENSTSDEDRSRETDDIKKVVKDVYVHNKNDSTSGRFILFSTEWLNN